MYRSILTLGSAVVVALAPTVSPAATITNASIDVDATSPAAVSVRHALTVRNDAGKAKTAIDLYLHRHVDVVAATSGGQKAELTASDVSGTHLKKWSVAVPAAGGGETRELTLEARIPAGQVPGLRVGPGGGSLLPGSGWFPATSPAADEVPVHRTKLSVPAGAVGIAAGTEKGAGAWATSGSARPFAAWGKFERTDTKASGRGTEFSFRVYRRAGTQGPVPGLQTIAELVHALQSGVGEACGEGAWTLVDVGHGTFAGGLRTVLWDEKAFAGASSGAAKELRRRDVSGALAASFWTECLTFRGDLAAWLARGFTHYLGDVATIALNTSDDRTELESIVIGARREAFLKGRKDDRALANAVPASDTGGWLLDTRGALVAHISAEAAPSRSQWVGFLGSVRREFAGKRLDYEGFREFAARLFPRQHDYVEPWLRTAKLPAFRIVDHGMGEGRQKNRYRVVVENQGDATAMAEVATYTAEGHPLRTYDMLIPAKEFRAVLFADVNRISRIVVEPRGVTPQSSIEGQVVDLGRAPDPNQAAHVPAFEFESNSESIRRLEGLSVDFEGFSIRNFEGTIQWYSTYHGPSGAALIGVGDVTIRPGGRFAESFREAHGRESLTYAGSRNMFIRFPLETWSKIEPHLLGHVSGNLHDVIDHTQWIYEAAFPTYFFQQNRAEIPPPGGGMITFIGPGEERLGFVQQPLPDGRVRARLWDHLSGETIWEEVR